MNSISLSPLRQSSVPLACDPSGAVCLSPSVANDKAPLSNTGPAISFCGVRGVTAQVDWLAFTDHKNLSPAVLLPHLPAKNWKKGKYGRFGYKEMIEQGMVKVYSAGTEVMGTHYSLSGQACRELEGLGMTDWVGYLAFLRGQGVTFTRFDGAFDDRSGRLNLRLMYDKFVARECCKHLQEYDWREGGGAHGTTGDSFAFGRRGGGVFIRGYDKFWEQVKKGKADRDAVEDWKRIELELRNESAAAAIDEIIRTGGLGCLAGILRSYIDFKEPGKDKIKSRWVTCDWWASFLGDAEKCTLVLEPVVPTIESKVQWLKSQVAPTLALFLEYCEGDMGPLLSMMASGRRRLGPDDYALLGAA